MWIGIAAWLAWELGWWLAQVDWATVKANQPPTQQPVTNPYSGPLGTVTGAFGSLLRPGLMQQYNQQYVSLTDSMLNQQQTQNTNQTPLTADQAYNEIMRWHN